MPITINKKINQHNAITEATYKIRLSEKRLILACIAQIKHDEPLKDFYEINAKNFSDLYGISIDTAYSELQQVAETLYDRSVIIKDVYKKTRTKFRWVEAIQYYDGEGKIGIQFTKWIAPYLSALNEQYTSYRLSAIANMKSIYSLRLYELLIQFRNINKRVITIVEFKRFFNLEEFYKRFTDLKKRVIEPSIKEINEYSDINVSYYIKKKNRTPWSIEFVFSGKEEINSFKKNLKKQGNLIETKEENEKRWKENITQLGYNPDEIIKKL